VNDDNRTATERATDILRAAHALARDGHDVGELRASLHDDLGALLRGDLDDDRRAPARVGDWSAEAVSEVERRATGKRRMVPVPWGDLAALYDGGLRPGVHVLTGGTGVGKTGWALRVAREAAGRGFPVLYAGLELDRVSILARLAAQARNDGTSWASLDWPRGEDPDDRVRALRTTARELDRLPFYVSEPPAMGWSVDDLRREVEHVRRAEPDLLADGFPVFVVIDFLQLVGPGEDVDGRTHPDDRDLRGRIRRAAYTTRQLTRDGDVCALLVSSVARSAYDEVVIDPEKQPPAPAALVGLGKESGEIEYAAHTVTCLARTKGTSDVWAVVAKNRTGRTGYAALDFDGQIGMHFDAAEARRKDAATLTRGNPLAQPKPTPTPPAETKPDPNLGPEGID